MFHALRKVLCRVNNKMARYSRRRGGVEDEEDSSSDEEVQTTKVEEPSKVVAPSTTDQAMGGRHRRSRGRRSASRVPKGIDVKAKTLRRLLKSKGLKSSGKKATLRARARKAHLIGGSTCNTGVPSSTAAGV